MKLAALMSVLGALVTLLASPLMASPTDSPTEAVELQPSAKCLNVVYFLGSDREPVEGYKERLSALLLYGQQFYGAEMQRNGYGARSFGLDMTTPQEVNLILYRAKGPASDYPYNNGGGYRASREVNEYLDASGLRKSDHTLIIFPTFYDDKNGDESPGGVPFYGLGKTCCALDYKHFDITHLGQETPRGRLLTKWYGGLLHELGHGLNLPHNHASMSEEARGTALMGSGNYTFGLKPTFITPGSCAILDACEVFTQDAEAIFYQQPVQLTLENCRVELKDGMILISGNYESDIEVASITVYVEEPSFCVNLDYAAHVFTQRQGSKTARFEISIPWQEVNGVKGNDFQVRLMFIMKNGKLLFRPFNFKHDALEAQSINKETL